MLKKIDALATKKTIIYNIKWVHAKINITKN